MSWAFQPLLPGAAQLLTEPPGSGVFSASSTATASFVGDTATLAYVSTLGAEVFYSATSDATFARVSALNAEVFYTAYTEARISALSVEVFRSAEGTITSPATMDGTSTASFVGSYAQASSRRRQIYVTTH